MNTRNRIISRIEVKPIVKIGTTLETAYCVNVYGQYLSFVPFTDFLFSQSFHGTETEAILHSQTIRKG